MLLLQAYAICKIPKNSQMKHLLRENRSWVTYFFRWKYNIEDGRLGSIFFTTSIIAALSTLAASSIAKRFGNINVRIPTIDP